MPAKLDLSRLPINHVNSRGPRTGTCPEYFIVPILSKCTIQSKIDFIIFRISLMYGSPSSKSLPLIYKRERSDGRERSNIFILHVIGHILNSTYTCTPTQFVTYSIFDLHNNQYGIICTVQRHQVDTSMITQQK